MFISYAQNFEDVMLWRAFHDIENGTYIDIGAQDPLIDSVSLAFHERGWKGLHVEPSSRYAEELRRRRPGDVVLQVAVSDTSTVIPFYEMPGTGISTIDANIAAGHRARGFAVNETVIPSIPLSTVFDSCGFDTIHWLKLDVEGAEFSALSSWGSGARRPWVLVIESTLPLSQVDSSELWEPLLVARSYERVYFDGLNRYYVAAEHSELKAAFSAPPNVFDAFAINGTASSSIHCALAERHRGEMADSAARFHQAAELQRLEIAQVERRLADSEAKLEDVRKQLGGQLDLALQAHLESQAQAARDLQMHCLEASNARAEMAVIEAGHAEELAAQASHLAALRAGQDEHRRETALHRLEIEGCRADVAALSSLCEDQQKQLERRRGYLETLRKGPAALMLALLGHPVPLTRIGLVQRPAASGRTTSRAARGSRADGASRAQPDIGTLDDLLVLNDADFVQAAYRSLLHREPDVSGEQNYIGMLRSGHDKVRILRGMARSEEGRRAGVEVPGLRFAMAKSAISRLPFVGALVGFVTLLVQQPTPRDAAAAYRSQSTGMHRAILEATGEIENTLWQLHQRQIEMEHSLRHLTDQPAIGVSHAEVSR